MKITDIFDTNTSNERSNNIIFP